MNQPVQAIWCLFAALSMGAIGCSDSSAPAMTSVSQAAASNLQNGAADGASADRDTPPNSVEDGTDAGSPEPVAATRPERTSDISFDDLKFEMKKGDPFERSMLTEKIEALEGKPIRIRGFILPSFQQAGITQFVLVRDNMSCCFGPGAALYDCIIVEMKPGKSTDYSLYPVAVEGTFSIREVADADGKTVAIYHLDGESVR